MTKVHQLECLVVLLLCVTTAGVWFCWPQAPQVEVWVRGDTIFVTASDINCMGGLSKDVATFDRGLVRRFILDYGPAFLRLRGYAMCNAVHCVADTTDNSSREFHVGTDDGCDIGVMFHVHDGKVVIEQCYIKPWSRTIYPITVRR